MLQVLILIVTHITALGFGFLIGVYMLPILTAPKGPSVEALAATATEVLYTARFERTLRGSDRLHWGEGEVRVLRHRIAHMGRLAPGPDYYLYLAPQFVDTKEGFLAIKEKSQRIGEIRTFNGFIVEAPPCVDVTSYTTVVVWCESFSAFISAAKYR